MACLRSLFFVENLSLITMLAMGKGYTISAIDRGLRILLLFFVLMAPTVGWGQVTTMAWFQFTRNTNPSSGSIGSPQLKSYDRWGGEPGSWRFSSNQYQTSANGDYLDITLSTENYRNVTIRWKGRSRKTSDGNQFRVSSYSSKTGWVDLYTHNLTQTLIENQTPLGSDFDNNPNVTIRISHLLSSNWSLIDDIIIEGEPKYCSSTATNTSYEYINKVQFGTISNTSGSSGYSDFTAQSTDVMLGSTNPLIVTNGNSDPSDYCGAWVDWNDDGDFDDADEVVGSSIRGTGPYAFNVNVPTGITAGKKRMRICISYNGIPYSCGNITYGEVEDYTVNVLPAVTYYSRGGDPTLLSSWSLNRTGAIASPTNFTNPNQVFVVQQNSTITASSAWNISGANTKLQLEDGATLTANAAVTLSSNTTLQLDANSTYAHNNTGNAATTFFNAGNEVIDPASTVTYGYAGAQNVAAAVYGNLTIAGGGAKTLQGDAEVRGTLDLQQGALALGGNLLTLSGDVTRTGAASGTITGGATSNLTIGGSGSLGTLFFTAGTQTLNNLTLNRTTSGVATLGTPLTINGTLTLTSGKLQLGNNDLTIANSSSSAITGGPFSASNMVETNGTGSLVKAGAAVNDFRITYPVGNGSVYAPVQIASISASGVNPNSTISVRAADVSAPSAGGSTPLNRYWITSTSGFSGSVLADISFRYDNGDVPVGTLAAQELMYKTVESGSWSYPGGASAAGSNPLRASAATNLDATWTSAVPIKHTFYSLKSGSWDDPTTWTFDPSGTQPLNPNNLTPSTSVTGGLDDVVVLSGRTVDVSANGKTNKRLRVDGTLNLATSINNSFQTIEGTGRIRLAGDNFPAGDASNFVTQGQGQGTVEYYGDTRSIAIPRTFYSVDVNMDAGKVLTLLASYTLNGNLTVVNGTLNINDNAATIPLDITVQGDVNVATAGKIGTGRANARHQLNLYGNFTNSGEVRFTNRTVANYTAEATDGIVDVNFINPSASQNVLCKGLTNFYRIKVDKGTDNTYSLNLDATASSSFNLLGYANQNHAAISQLVSNSNALGLIRGTIRIGNSIVIPTLSTASRYVISEAAQLWINGGVVQKNSGQTIAVYGKLRATTGLLEAKIQDGITLCSNGSLYVDGGIVNVNQIHTSDEVDGPHNGAYIQSGGTVNVLGGTCNSDHYVFSLPSTASVFNMSGGMLKINMAAGNGAILINSDAENAKVTGGVVVGETTTAGSYIVTSRAPFWNLELRSTSAGSGLFTLGAASNIGANNVNVPVQPLRVLNDFKIWGQESGGAAYKSVSFNPSVNDVYIGGSFIVEKGAAYRPISGGTAPYDNSASQPTVRNTTFFNKTAGTSAVETLYWGDATNPLEMGNVVVDRTSGYEMRLASVLGRANESVAIDINGTTSVQSGTLNQNLYTIRTWGAIVNNGRMGTWYPGVTPSRAQIQIVENPALTLTTSADAVFGNVQVNVTPPAKLTLTSDTYVERMEYVKGLIYLKGYILKVDNLWNMESGIFENYTANSYLKVANNGYSGSSMIFTDGKASDGGLSLKVTANSQTENQNNIINNFGPITYPVGFTTDGGTTLYFRPAQMMVKNFSSDGYVTIRPVSGSLQTTNQSGGEVLQHYWRVSHGGFSAVPTVAYRFYYRNQNKSNIVDLAAGAANEATYVPGKVLDENPYTRQYETSNDIIKGINADGKTRFITINGTSTGGAFTPPLANGVTLENANYTAGVQNRFTGSVLIYYTRDYEQEARWTNTNAWTRSDKLDSRYAPHDSRQPASTTIPGAGDVAVIGWIPWTDANRSAAMRGQPHGVWIDGNTQQVAEVVFTKMTDAAGNPVPRNYRSNFQFRPTLCINQPAGQLVAKLVKGEGLFWNRESDPDYTKMDIGDFARQDSSYVIYENFTNGRVINNTPPLFPNIYISNDNWGANDHNFTFSRDITTTGNVELLGNVNLVLPIGATGNITVGRDLVMFVSQNSGSGASINYGNQGISRRIVVKRDLLMKNAGSIIQVLNPNATAPLVDHELHVEGNIIQGTPSLNSTGLNLWSGPSNDRVTLYLDGPNSMTYTKNNGAAPNLYRLVVNKGNTPTATAQFNTDYILRGPTSGVGVAKALEIRNGTFISNNPTARVLDLTTGNDYFEIPSTAGFELMQGTARATGNSGISLDGMLTISGGTLDMTGGDNSIEYSASGNATIAISGGNLNVGGQIRRSLTSDAGILKYNQTGGNVVVGQYAANASARGVFEILNTGSSFSMSAGNLYIARAQTSPEIAAFYFNPATYSIGAAANIHVGHLSTPSAQTLGIYAGKPLPQLRVNNESGRNPVAQLQVVPATISSLLTIDAGANFDANGVDLTLNGNMTCNGTYLPKGNTTYFSGTGTQTISSGGGTINFYNFDKTSSSNVTLATNTPLLVSNELLLRAGTFTTNLNTVTTNGNVLNDAVHVSTIGATDGIVLKGTANQILTGNGTFGKLTINNPSGVDVPVGNQLKITNSLKMKAGIFNIGKNLLDLGVDALIERAAPFSVTNMITTNISFTDNGVRKFFSAGAKPDFVFPVGAADRYTPVTVKVDANTSSDGSITVKPANEMHPSIIEDTETGQQIVDKDNVLQYYWTLKADKLSGFSGAAKMKYADADVKVTTPYTVADYITARLLSDGSGNWNKFSTNDFDEGSKELNFTYTNTDAAGVSGDYTAGACDISKNGAIPDNVAKYETIANGNWSTATVWTPNVAGGPRGAIAKINTAHTVDVTVNNLSGYLTEVFGKLKLNSTYGHRLGIVNGIGTIYSEIGEIPAAVYDNFFSSEGGTLEFGGVGKSYEFLGNIFEVNHLKMSGSGERRFPNNSITLNGDLIISGDAGLNLLNYYNRKIGIKGDVIRNGGSFDAGSGPNATVSLEGTLAQSMSGSFSNANALNNLEVNNSNGVSIINDVEIDRELKLTNGVINATVGSLFRLNYGGFVAPAAGSSLSFVNGTFTKEMMTGNSFLYPVGSDLGIKAHGPISLLNVSGPSGINDWSVAYSYANANNNGMPVANFESPITTVSNSEFWKIQAPAGGQSKISITLDGSSDVGNTIVDTDNLRIVGWNAVNSRWEVVGGGSSTSGSKTNGTVTTTSSVNFGSYSYFTLGSIMPLSASSASFTSPPTVPLCSGTPTTLTVAFSGAAPWVLTYKAGATSITTPPLAVSPYNITVAPTSTTTYTLTGVTANGVVGTITGTTSVTVNVNPIPTVVLSSNDADNTICEGTSITFTATAGLTKYVFRVNGVVMQTGGSNTYTTVLSAGTQSVDVVVSNMGGCSSTSSAVVVTVNPKPAAAEAIIGAVSVCKGAVNQAYSVPSIGNATSYIWTFTNGATGTSSTNGINVKFPNSGTSIITVKGNNSCGDGVSSSLNVAVNTSSATGAAGAISGIPIVCKGGSGYAYSVPAVANATSYIWSYTGTGATINGSSNTVTVDFSPSATSGSLRVAGTNGCNTGTSSGDYPITINTPPTATISPLSPSVCSGSSVVITASPTGGSGSYASHLWTGTGSSSLSSGAVTNPSFTNSIAGSYDLTYTVTDSKGCIGTATTTVVVNQAPVADAGPDASGICTGTSPIQLSGASAAGSYSGSPLWSGTGGVWTQNPDPALATFTPSTPSGSATLRLTLTGANGCGNVYDEREISWNKTPDQPGDFTASTATACKGQSNVIFKVPDDPLATSYDWSYSGSGATISFIRNEATVAFSTTATDGTISVTASNGCGKSVARTQAVTVSQCTPLKPVTPTTTTNPICQGTASSTVSISAAPVGADANLYVWTLSPSTAGTITGTTASATIAWDAAFSGNATVTVTARNASGSGPVSDALTITIKPAPAVTWDAANVYKGCADGTTVLTLDNITTGLTYTWSVQDDVGVVSSNSNQPTITWLSNGAIFGAGVVQVSKNVTVVVTGGNGCAATLTKSVTVYRRPVTGPPYHIGNNIAK